MKTLVRQVVDIAYRIFGATSECLRKRRRRKLSAAIHKGDWEKVNEMFDKMEKDL